MKQIFELKNFTNIYFYELCKVKVILAELLFSKTEKFTKLEQAIMHLIYLCMYLCTGCPTKHDSW